MKSVLSVLLQFKGDVRAIKESQREMMNLRKQTMSLSNTFRSGLGIGAGILSVQALTRSIRGAINEGIEFNRIIQDTTDSLRAMAIAGEAQGDIAKAGRISIEVMTLLRQRANDTGEALGDVVSVFQESAAVAATSGISLKEWADIAVEATRAGANMGLEVGRIRTQLGQIATGEIRRTNVLGTALGLDSETLRAAMEAGTLVDLLRQKLEPYQTRVEGLSAAQNRLKNTLQESWGQVAMPLFEQLQKESENLTGSIMGNTSGMRIFGGVLADAARLGALFLRVMIQYGPALAAIGSGIVAVKMGAFIAALVVATRAKLAATTAARALGVAMAALTANPFLAISAAITAVVMGIYFWNLRQREVARRVRETRMETDRIRAGMADRIAGLTSEEARQSSIADITSRILSLEKQITQEKNRQARAELLRQKELLESELGGASSTTPQQMRDNERAIRERREREAALLALPDRIREQREREEARRLATVSVDERIATLVGRRAELAQAATGGEVSMDSIDGLREAADEAAKRAAQSTAALKEAQRVTSQTNLEELWESVNDATLGADVAEAVAAKAQAELDAAEVALSRQLDAAGQLASIDEQLDEARRVRDEDAARRAQDLAQLSIEQIKLTEQEARQSFERNGGDAREYYAELVSLADQRWQREIRAAQAIAQASGNEADQIRATNLERQRSIEIRGLELDRDRQLERQARRLYETSIEGIQAMVREIDSQLVDPANVSKRTSLERERERLVSRALALFREYKSEVSGLGLPEQGLAAAPGFEDAPESRDGLQRVGDDFGNVRQNIDDGIVSIAGNMRNEIGNAIEDLINKTAGWGDVLRNVARGFGMSMIRAITDIVVQWGIAQAAMFLRSIFTRKATASANIAVSAAEAGALSLIWAAPATLATIATLGAAAAQAPFSIAAAKAATLATSAVPGFYEGGFTGAGGIVHEDEWVSPKWMVNDPNIGPMIGELEGIRKSGRSPSNPVSSSSDGGMGSGSSARSPRGQRLVLVDNRTDARRVRGDPDYEDMIMDVVDRNVGRLGKWT